MKALFIIAATLTTTLSFAQSKTESEILALSKRRVEWLLQGKADSLASLYDTAAITVHGNGMLRPATDYVNDVRSGRPLYRTIDYKEATVKEFGNTVILVGKGTFNISIDGQEMSQNMVFTEVYTKRNGAWKLIARHASQLQ